MGALVGAPATVCGGRSLPHYLAPPALLASSLYTVFFFSFPYISPSTIRIRHTDRGTPCRHAAAPSKGATHNVLAAVTTSLAEGVAHESTRHQVAQCPWSSVLNESGRSPALGTTERCREGGSCGSLDTGYTLTGPLPAKQNPALSLPLSPVPLRAQ